MPKNCAAFGCTNNSSKQHCKEKGISFFAFPLKYPDMLKEWIVKVKRERFKPTGNSTLCSEHFTDEDFVYQNFTQKRLLKKGAIPSVFAYKPTSKRKRTSYQFGVLNANATSENSNEDVDEPNEEDVDEPTEQMIASSSTSKEIGVQTDSNAFSTIINMNDELSAVVLELRNEVMQKDWSPDNEQLRNKLSILTGFDEVRFDVIRNFLHIPDSATLTGQMKLFIFLIRLRTGITEEIMGIMFGMSQSTISRIFSEMTIIIYDKIKNIKIWPSKNQVQCTMPPLFRQNYPECRVIIDCTEFIIQKPSDPKEQQITFSYYKNANTVKSLIGITPAAAVCFISDTWTGSISDKDLFVKSGILNLLERDDLIIADRGFTIRNEVENAGCKLVTPHFLKDKIQFTFNERLENKKVSCHRIHVERAIGRIKLFKLLDGPIPYTLLPNIHMLIYISAFLINFGTRLL